MPGQNFSRRDVLRSSTALAVTVFAAPARASAPPPQTITPALIEAAKQEGLLVWYTSADLQLAELVGKTFERKFPGIATRVERAGGERIFTRVAQEYAAGIHTPDAVSTGDAAQFLAWKRQGLLAPYVPEDVARHIPAEHRDGDGTYATVRSSLCVIAYNTELVQRADAPKSFADLLDPKWSGKIVKAHPSYSGGIVTSTFQTVRELGWDYLKKLGQQKVLQVQSATEPPKKLALGERPVSADGLEYVHILMKEQGAPIEIVYPSEGTPVIPGCEGIASKAPHPNAAKLFMSFMVARETQQYLVDEAGLRSFHPDVKDKPGRVPLSKIKLMKSDPVAQEKMTDEIKKRYAEYFGI